VLVWCMRPAALRAEPVEPLTLKGKANPVPAYRLVGLADGVPARAARAGSTHVGREEELARLHREPLDPELARVTAQTLVVAGERDPLCPPRAAEIVAGAIPGARVEVPDC